MLVSPLPVYLSSGTEADESGQWSDRKPAVPLQPAAARDVFMSFGFRRVRHWSRVEVRLNHVGTGPGWRCFLQGPLHCGSRVEVCLNHVGTGRVEVFSSRAFTLPSRVLTMWVLVPGGGVFFKGLYTSQQGLNHVGTGRGWRCFLQGPLHCGSRVEVCLNYVGTGRVEVFSARTFTLPSKVLTMWVLVPGGGVFCLSLIHI